MNFIEQLQRLNDIRERVAHIHPCLTSPFPVAIAVDGEFLVHDAGSRDSYEWIHTEATPFPIPTGVRAAFPLEFYGNRAAAVITPDAFDSLEDLVTVLHEFVHCFQWATCEQRLRAGLEIEKVMKSHGSIQWEIEFPFPYSDPAFETSFSEYLSTIRSDEARMLVKRNEVLDSLQPLEREYFWWQEWKEGFARFVENKMRDELELPENCNGSLIPYSRQSFYFSGSAYIHWLSVERGVSTDDLGQLFEDMRS